MSTSQPLDQGPQSGTSGEWSPAPETHWESTVPVPPPMASPPEYPGQQANRSFVPSAPPFVNGQTGFHPPGPDHTTTTSIPTGTTTSIPTGARRRRMPRGLVASIVTAIILVVLIIVALIMRLNPDSPFGDKEANLAKQGALDYLTAISEGRAADAAAMLPDSSVDRSLLTAEVLQDSLQRAPISNISAKEIKRGGTNTFIVTITYQIADQTTSDDLYVALDNGRASLYSATATLTLEEMQGIPVTVNGVPAASDRPQLFPGSYRVVLDSDYLTFTDKAVLIPNSDSPVARYALGLRVSDAGVAMFREKVIAQAQTCLASTAIDPGCGAALPTVLDGGGQIREGSIQRGQDAEARAQLQAVTPEPGKNLITVITADGTDMGKLSVTADCNEQGQWQRCELQGYGAGMYLGNPSINLNDPNLSVQWD